MTRLILIVAIGVLQVAFLSSCQQQQNQQNQEFPNVVLIYTDDVGYGDLSSYDYGAIPTPNIDQLAENGVLFTDAHATSATCTPSRFGLLTGVYPWRRKGTQIAPGDAAMIIPPDQFTMADLFKSAGYATAVVGKWHLGLGPQGGPDWNTAITPGPAEIGFDYSYLIPATGDRVPCVYVENGKVVDLDPNDPIAVSFGDSIGSEPTASSNPELLKMHPSHGHDKTIINGISRIGYMTGGQQARWRDEDMADQITSKARSFIKEHSDQPFFLYYSTHDIHVPRVPHERFAGKSGHGPRGDVLLQLDWAVGSLVEQLEELKLLDNTLIIFTSDNGPVLDDGYQDQAVELIGNHQPSGPYRGGKYSTFEAGTRVPLIVHWPSKVNPGIADHLFSQVDLVSSFATLLGQEIPGDMASDSESNLPQLLNRSNQDRDFAVEHAASQTLSLIKDDWKYIEPNNGRAVNPNTNIELGHNPEHQLYNLKQDPGETNNLATENPAKVQEMIELLNKIRAGERLSAEKI